MKLTDSVLVGREHADALDPDGQQDEFENDNACHDENDEPRQRDFGIAADDSDAKPARQRAPGPAGVCLIRVNHAHPKSYLQKSTANKPKRNAAAGQALDPGVFPAHPPYRVGSRCHQ